MTETMHEHTHRCDPITGVCDFTDPMPWPWPMRSFMTYKIDDEPQAIPEGSIITYIDASDVERTLRVDNASLRDDGINVVTVTCGRLEVDYDAETDETVSTFIPDE